MVVDAHRLKSMTTVVMMAILATIYASATSAQDWSQVYQGVVQDQIRAQGWFQDAAAKGVAQAQSQAGLGSLYNLGLMNDLGNEGVRQQLEAQEWFQNASKPGPKDIKTIYQQLQ